MASRYPQQLGARLHRWHKSAGDPIYKVGSYILAGMDVDTEDVDAAIHSLGLAKYRHTSDDSSWREIDRLQSALSRGKKT